MNESTQNKIMLAGLIGFAAGVLFAPDKGVITRDKLKRNVDTVAEKAQQQTDKAKSKINEIKNRKDRVAKDVDESIDRVNKDLNS